MPEIEIFLNSEEMDLLKAAFNALDHDAQSQDVFSTDIVRSAIASLEDDLNGQQGRLKS